MANNSMGNNRKVLNWLTIYGGGGSPVTGAGKRALGVAGWHEPEVIDVGYYQYDELLRQMASKIGRQHDRVLKAIRAAKDNTVSGGITEADFLAYLRDYYTYQRAKLSKAKYNGRDQFHGYGNDFYRGGDHIPNYSAIDRELARGDVMTNSLDKGSAARQRELRYHERDRQDWQRKHDIGNQFRTAVTTGRIPAPQATNDVKRRSKLEQLQQAGLAERYTGGRGGSSSQTSRSRSAKKSRFLIDEDEEEIQAARHSAYNDNW